MLLDLESILKLKTIAKDCINYIIGDSNRTSLWYDKWHPFNTFTKKYVERMIYDIGLSKTIKVKAIIRDGTWYRSSANSWVDRD